MAKYLLQYSFNFEINYRINIITIFFFILDMQVNQIEGDFQLIVDPSARVLIFFDVKYNFVQF